MHRLTRGHFLMSLLSPRSLAECPTTGARRLLERVHPGTRHLMIVLLLSSGLQVSSAQQNDEKAPVPSPPGWVLTWNDEFDGPNGSAPDPGKWTVETGGNGWGNNELEYYTTSSENLRLENGNLIIQAIKEKHVGADGVQREYTSGRLKTEGKFSQQYGRFEARIKIPRGQGIWPAFWMMGDDLGKLGWPKCGEIDIMENIGKEPALVHGTIHGPGYSGDKGIGSSFSLPDNSRFADDFHIYAVEWEPKAIRFYVDDHLYATRTPTEIPQGTKWAYDHPFFILLNVAVGGGWPGNPDATSQFPQTMLVDYVRVYKPAGN